ncbi:hypothetical protein PMIN06_003225 [Paraphaeosphaeria minitans]
MIKWYLGNCVCGSTFWGQRQVPEMGTRAAGCIRPTVVLDACSAHSVTGAEAKRRRKDGRAEIGAVDESSGEVSLPSCSSRACEVVERRTGGQEDRRTGGQEDRRTGGQERRTGGQEERRTGG